MKTEFDIQKALYEKFETLTDYITSNNVYYNDNSKFTIPADKRFFKLAVVTDEPESVGAFVNDLHRFTGFLQIDICTPLDKGELEAETKYKAICNLFAEGSTFGDIEINKVYIPTKSVEDSYFKVVVRINFTATLDNKE